MNNKINNMIIEKDKVISVIYKLSLNDDRDTIIENVEKSKPLVFIYGRGNLLKDFEMNIDKMKLNDSFDFVLTSKQAYGEILDEAVINIPKETFVVNGELNKELLKVGNHIPMADQSGKRITGKILDIDEKEVKMDFNHPLAGKDLHFKGSIVDIRDASKEEKEHGHVHMHEHK